MRLRRRRDETPKLPTEKPYLVTIHAEHDQYHTFAMGPGDGVGVGAIRIDIAHDGSIHASPLAHKNPERVETQRTPQELTETVTRLQQKQRQRSGQQQR